MQSGYALLLALGEGRKSRSSGLNQKIKSFKSTYNMSAFCSVSDYLI